MPDEMIAQKSPEKFVVLHFVILYATRSHINKSPPGLQGAPLSETNILRPITPVSIGHVRSSVDHCSHYMKCRLPAEIRDLGELLVQVVLMLTALKTNTNFIGSY